MRAVVRAIICSESTNDRWSSVSFGGLDIFKYMSRRRPPVLINHDHTRFVGECVDLVLARRRLPRVAYATLLIHDPLTVRALVWGGVRGFSVGLADRQYGAPTAEESVAPWVAKARVIVRQARLSEISIILHPFHPRNPDTRILDYHLM